MGCYTTGRPSHLPPPIHKGWVPSNLRNASKDKLGLFAWVSSQNLPRERERQTWTFCLGLGVYSIDRDILARKKYALLFRMGDASSWVVGLGISELEFPCPCSHAFTPRKSKSWDRKHSQIGQISLIRSHSHSHSYSHRLTLDTKKHKKSILQDHKEKKKEKRNNKVKNSNRKAHPMKRKKKHDP